MHVSTMRRQHKDKVYETVLLRRSFREDGKVKNETLANLSHLPPEVVELVRQALAGKSHVVAGEGWEIERSLPHGHVAAVCSMASRLGLAALLGPACAERDLALALIVARVAKPASKLATGRWWADTTLGADLGVRDAQHRRHLRRHGLARRAPGAHRGGPGPTAPGPGAMVMFDLSSSWMEGSQCPLAARGYSRDGKAAKAQIEYGLMTDVEGRPLAVEVFAGNTADPVAFVAAVGKVRERFKLSEVVMVGDRGMITSARIDAIRELGGLGWVSALRAPAIKKLVADGTLQLGLFDEMDLAEIAHPDFPGERLVACKNPLLADERARKRNELLDATEALLGPVRLAVDAGRLVGADRIGMRAGKSSTVTKWPNISSWPLPITPGLGTQGRPDQRRGRPRRHLRGPHQRQRQSASTPPAWSCAYKDLAKVERDFRSLKAIDLDLRPIYHHLEDRVRAHVFICMLAAYLVWHLRQAWAPLTFTDESPPEATDPVAPAPRSEAARTKDSRHSRPDGGTVHDLARLLNHLATLTRNTIVFAGGVRIDKLAVPTPLQRQPSSSSAAPIPTISARRRQNNTLRNE